MMADDPACPAIALGFLTVVESDPHGLFGGLLLLNPAARPIEFLCTAPVRPNRAQQILYGPTLAPYLYGEQIGQALLGKASQKPCLILTDCPAALALQPWTTIPVALVEAQGNQTADSAVHRDDVTWGGFRVRPARPADEELRAMVERLTEAGVCWDLLEPFGRIREAIEEAQRSSQARSAAA
jgi:hypothetical protein